MDEYAMHIIKTYGLSVLEELHRLKHTAKKWTRAELEDLINKYRGLIKEMA